MPELPDVELYCAALRERILGHPLVGVRLLSPFVLRTVEPAPDDALGASVAGVSRIGKRIVIELRPPGGDAACTAVPLAFVLHLMIAGRLRWTAPGKGPPARITLVTFTFATGGLHLTEAGSQRRAALHIVRGEGAARQFDAGGLEVLTSTSADFAAALRRESHTLKRALTDPRLFAGIGNAYSDEILHAARLSPLALSRNLDDAEVERLHIAAAETLATWTQRLQSEFAGRFPGAGDVTAFRADFAVHGRYGEPCPDCGLAVQRIRYAENETNYCPRCQTGGRVLADRSLSRLLKDDWPRQLEPGV